MAVANDILRHERLPHNVVAATVGYRSGSAFSTAFRKEIGKHRANISGPPWCLPSRDRAFECAISESGICARSQAGQRRGLVAHQFRQNIQESDIKPSDASFFNTGWGSLWMKNNDRFNAGRAPALALRSCAG
jgi:hypothetical protein